MTPPSIHRIQSDDELLDRIGSRTTARDGVPDDGLTDLLTGWAAHVDDAPAASVDTTPGRYARTRRGGVRAGIAAAVLVGTLSVSGMAAAMTSTTVPVLEQLGQVTRGLVFVPPEAATQHQTPSPGAPITDGTATTFLTAPPAPGTPQDRYSSSSSSFSPSSIFRRPAPGSTSLRRPSSRTEPSSTPPLTTKPTTTAPTTTAPTTPPRTTAPTTAPTSTVTPTTPPTSTGSPPTSTSGPTRTVRPTMPTSPGASSPTTTVPTTPTPRLSTSTSSSPPAPSSTPTGSAG